MDKLPRSTVFIAVAAVVAAIALAIGVLKHNLDRQAATQKALSGTTPAYGSGKSY